VYKAVYQPLCLSKTSPNNNSDAPNTSKLERSGRRRRRKDGAAAVPKIQRNLQYPESKEEYELSLEYDKKLKGQVKELAQSPEVDQYFDVEPSATKLPIIDFAVAPNSKLTPITGLVPEKNSETKEPQWIKKVKLFSWVGIGLLVLLEIVVHLPFIKPPTPS
jgi:hypothetical protein